MYCSLMCTPYIGRHGNKHFIFRKGYLLYVAIGEFENHLMHCDGAAVAAESYIGLVEMGVGLIPGAGGLMRMVERAADRAASDAPSHIQPFLTHAFQTIAMAKVSGSAQEAQQMGYLLPTAQIVMPLSTTVTWPIAWPM